MSARPDRWKVRLFRLTVMLGCSLAAGCQDAAGPARGLIETQEGSAAISDEDGNASATFTIQDLGVLPGGSTSEGYGINTFGDVAGFGNTPSGATLYHPILWTGTTATDLGVPFGNTAGAYDVNDSRTVVGTATNGVERHGFLWKAGVFTLISAPSWPHSLDAFALNNSDVVVGYYVPSTGSGHHAFRYDKADGLVDIHPPGYLQSMATAISDQGVIVGNVVTLSSERHAARWSSQNGFTDLGTLGGNYSAAYGVNNAGAIVGESRNAAGTVEPFVWRSATGMVGGGRPGIARDISDRGRIVGSNPSPPGPAGTKKGSTAVAFLPTLPGGLFASAMGVNRCGNISGTAFLTGAVYHAVRWVIASCD